MFLGAKNDIRVLRWGPLLLETTHFSFRNDIHKCNFRTQMVSIDSSQCSLSKHVVVLYETINDRLFN